jgi:hypothetical protein
LRASSLLSSRVSFAIRFLPPVLWVAQWQVGQSGCIFFGFFISSAVDYYLASIAGIHIQASDRS